MTSTQVIVSKHAKKRIKERIGVPKRCSESVAQKAFDSGVSHSASKGRLKRWISKLFLEKKEADNIKIFGNHVFLFRGKFLITVMHLPKEMNGAYKKSKTNN